jgi:hypothetical protein
VRAALRCPPLPKLQCRPPSQTRMGSASIGAWRSGESWPSAASPLPLARPRPRESRQPDAPDLGCVPLTYLLRVTPGLLARPSNTTTVWERFSRRFALDLCIASMSISTFALPSSRGRAALAIYTVRSRERSSPPVVGSGRTGQVRPCSTNASGCTPQPPSRQQRLTTGQSISAMTRVRRNSWWWCLLDRSRMQNKPR